LIILKALNVASGNDGGFFDDALNRHGCRDSDRFQTKVAPHFQVGTVLLPKWVIEDIPVFKFWVMVLLVDQGRID